MPYRLNHERMPVQTAHRNVVQLIYFAHQLEAIGTKLREVEPIGRNFEIMFDSDAGTLSLLHHETDQVLCLNTLLPEGYRFEAGEDFIISWSDKTIFFQSNQVEYRTFMMSIFHEMGHILRDKSGEYKMYIKAIGAFVQSLGAWTAQMTMRLIKRTKAPAKPKLSTLPLWFIKDYEGESIFSERQALAVSLRMLRDLQDQWWNVFAGFEWVQELRDYIDYALFTHEVEHAMFMLEMVDEESIESINVEFVKNKKRFQERFQMIFEKPPTPSFSSPT